MRLARIVCGIGAMLLAQPSYAIAVYSGSNQLRFYPGNPSNGQGGPGVWWYSAGPLCADGLQVQVRYFPSSAAACTAEGQTQLNRIVASATDATTQCYTVSATLSTINCNGTGQHSGDVYPYDVCNVTVSKNGRSAATYFPAFVLHSLAYAIPGDKSTATYTNGISSGTTWSISTATTLDVNAGFTFPLVLDVSAGLKVTNSDSTKTSIQDNKTAGLRYSYSSDWVDHTQDRFTLWVNPTLAWYTGCAQPDYAEWGAGNRPWINPSLPSELPVFLSFTVAELLNPPGIPDSDTYRKTFISLFDPATINQQILAFDPFVACNPATLICIINNSPSLDPNRFRPVQGCNSFFDVSGVSPSVGDECKASYTSTLDTTTSWTQDWYMKTKLSVLDETKTGFVGNANLDVAYSRSTDKASGTKGSRGNYRSERGSPGAMR